MRRTAYGTDLADPHRNGTARLEAKPVTGKSWRFWDNLMGASLVTFILSCIGVIGAALAVLETGRMTQVYGWVMAISVKLAVITMILTVYASDKAAKASASLGRPRMYIPANATAVRGGLMLNATQRARLGNVRQATLAAMENGYTPSRWPVTYAADFLRAHPELLPDTVGVDLDAGSRASAIHAIRCWATAMGVPVAALNKVLADAYLIEHHIPPGHADEQRTALYESYIDR
jgi:hypothetical protein